MSRPIGSRYVLDEVLGRGAMGTVWRGSVRETGEPVAIKVLREDVAEDPEVVSRFLQERTVLLRLRHPHVVAVRDLVVEGDLLAMVMELIDGGDLRTFLRVRGQLPPAEAVRYAAEVAEALAAAHTAGIVHRDLKPANVMVAQEEDGPSMRLTDFGVARIMDRTGITRGSGVVLGTPNYLAPELALGERATPAVDVYALGVVLYELLSGRPPFDGENPFAVLHRHMNEAPAPLPELPAPVWEVVAACLAKHPGERPGAGVLAERLRAVGSWLEEGGRLGPFAYERVPAVAAPAPSTTAAADPGSPFPPPPPAPGAHPGTTPASPYPGGSGTTPASPYPGGPGTTPASPYPGGPNGGQGGPRPIPGTPGPYPAGTPVKPGFPAGHGPARTREDSPGAVLGKILLVLAAVAGLLLLFLLLVTF